MDCTFCGGEVPRGKGKILVKKSGETFPYCSSKCERNAALGRINRRVQWTKASRIVRGKVKA